MKKILTSNGKPLVKDGKVFLSSGGSSVIEVEELPTENVQDLTFYKKTIQTNSDVYLNFQGTTMAMSSIGANIYTVDSLPDNMEVTNMENGIYNFYIFDNIAYLYDGSNVMTFGEFYTSLGAPLEDKGAVESVDQITSEGSYVIYGKESVQIGVKNETYNFVDSVWHNYYEFYNGFLFGTISELDNPNLSVVRKYMFKDFMNLKFVNLPNCIEIEDNGFNNCWFLENVYLQSCKTICDGGFEDTHDFNLYLGCNEVVSITNKTFNLAQNITVHVRAELLSDYQADTNWAGAVSNGYIILVGDYTD